MASTYLSRNQTGNTYTRTWTLSWWFKRSKLGTVQRMWTSDDDASGNNDDFFQWQTNDSIQFGFYASGYYAKMHTNRKFRDTNAWYHCVFAWDSTQTTASDRIKVYINGVQETSWLASDYPNQNSNSFIGGWSSNLYPIECGRRGLDNTQHFDGSMSHCHFTDGTAYDASAFGETDATTGEWKIKTSPSVTYGTNGFFILKDGNSVTDQSGEGNNFTVGGGTLTKTEDSPSNVFATLNPLATSSYNSLTQGNNTVKGNTATNDGETYSTLGTSNSGKYYWEIKATGLNGVGNPKIGFVQSNRTSVMRLQNGGSGYGGAESGSLDIMTRPDGKVLENGSTSSVLYGAYSAGNIISFALDSDNGAFYYGINGTWQNSGNPASGASRTGAIKTWTPTDAKALGGQHVCIGTYDTATQADCNFGNGYFGTTAVSSAGSNASGNGIFEYDVPTGYTALSTKGLNL